MKLTLRRIIAYFIDIILITLVATFISSNDYINKDYDKYKKVYDEYSDKYDEYTKYYTKLENYYEDSKITEKEYTKLLDNNKKYSKNLIKYYDDKEITNEEYTSAVEELSKEYSNIETNYSYKLLKYSYIPTIVNLMCILIYFVVFQYYFNGQTLGKKIMKLRIISNNEKKLSILNYLIRSLIVNEVVINIISLICLIFLSKNNYIAYNQIIYVITYIIEMVILFMIAFDRNNRGLHDYISNTKVIDSKKE